MCPDAHLAPILLFQKVVIAIEMLTGNQKADVISLPDFITWTTIVKRGWPHRNFYHGVKVQQQALCSESLNLRLANKAHICNTMLFLRVYFGLKHLEVEVAASSTCKF